MGKILREGNRCIAPDIVTIPYIESDDLDKDVAEVCQSIADTAVRMAYRGKRFIKWLEVLAGKKAYAYTGEYLPDETVEALKKHLVCLKGNLLLPEDGTEASVGERLYKELDLYTSHYPIKWLPGIACMLRKPERLGMHLFCHNGESEDIQRTVHTAFNFALRHHPSNITFLHDGNMNALVKQCYRIADVDYLDHTFSMDTFSTFSGFWGKDVAEEEYVKAMLNGKIIVKDVDEDTFVKNTLMHPEEYAVVISLQPGDLSIVEQMAKLAGVSNLIPKCGINYENGYAVFEAGNGIASQGVNASNPTSMILSLAAMLEYVGWSAASRLIIEAMEVCYSQGLVTKDMNDVVLNSQSLTPSRFCNALLDRLGRKLALPENG